MADAPVAAPAPPKSQSNTVASLGTATGGVIFSYIIACLHEKQILYPDQNTAYVMAGYLIPIAYVCRDSLKTFAAAIGILFEKWLASRAPDLAKALDEAEKARAAKQMTGDSQ